MSKTVTSVQVSVAQSILNTHSMTTDADLVKQAEEVLKIALMSGGING